MRLKSRKSELYFSITEVTPHRLFSFRLSFSTQYNTCFSQKWYSSVENCLGYSKIKKTEKMDQNSPRKFAWKAKKRDFLPKLPHLPVMRLRSVYSLNNANMFPGSFTYLCALAWTSGPEEARPLKWRHHFFSTRVTI